MGVKHRIKLFAREAYARLLFHTGLHALVDRLQPRRLTILAGHCVSAPSNLRLPKDMKIRAADLERILAWFATRYDVVHVAEGVKRLEAGPTRSLLALSMDDGYVDNRTHLLPILEKLGVSATIYLETRPLDERRVNWSHKFFACVDVLGLEGFIHRFTELSRDTKSNILLNQLVPHGEATSYHVKRLLKYEVPPGARSTALDLVFVEVGGDERALCDELYMTWDDARALDRAGLDLGGHTVNHEILARLDDAGQQAEIEGCRRALQAGLGHATWSFAYPFGRNWDYDDRTRAAVRAVGFSSATTTHAGTNAKHSDRTTLKRLMIDEDAQLHLIVAEACGGFDLLRKVGIELGA